MAAVYAEPARGIQEVADGRAPPQRDGPYLVRFVDRHPANHGAPAPGGSPAEERRDTLEDARNFAMELVADGRAAPSSISIYERTSFQVAVSCDPAAPQAPRR